MTNDIESITWSEVVVFYRGLVHDSGWAIGPMLELVEFLSSSPYAEHLYPTTSMARLCIGRVSRLRFRHEMLIIEFDSAEQRFTFEYHQAGPQPAPWVTSCEAAAGRERLERVLKKRLRWFKEAYPEEDD